jgi:hypothetical protein
MKIYTLYIEKKKLLAQKATMPREYLQDDVAWV